MRTGLWLLGGVLTLALAGPASAAPIKLGKYAQVYKGPKGAQVAVVDAGEKQALVKVSGIETDADGLVLLCEVKPAGRGGKSYVTTYHGRAWTILATRPGRWGGGEDVFLSPPGVRSMNVGYDEKASKALKPGTLLALHKRQGAKLKAFATFNRKNEEAYQEKKLAEVVKRINQACGTSITVKLDWSKVTDELLKSYSIYGYCENNLDGLRRMCGKDLGKQAVSARVKSVVCRFGTDKHKVRVKGSTVEFDMNKDKGNQTDYATAVLENEIL